MTRLTCSSRSICVSKDLRGRMTRRVQRLIDPDRWTDRGLLARTLSPEARIVGAWLWGLVDDEGRMEVRPELLHGDIFPGDARVTPEDIESHLLELDEAGFLHIYQREGVSYLVLHRPLQTPRPKASDVPEPPPLARPEVSGNLMAVGGGREWARERVHAEGAERASEWATWSEEQERGRETRPPARPLLLDAPPIGCPDHPHGRYEDCGPCGTARRRHDKWVQQQRYEEQLAKFAESGGADVA